MGQKGKERDFQERQRIRWFQWEFLRRNSEYERDCDEFMARFGPWFMKRGYWYQLQRHDVTYADQDLLFYYNKIRPTLKVICAKWCISDPFPPDWTFDKRGYRVYGPRKLVSLPTGYTPEEAASLWDTGPVEVVSGNRTRAFSERLRLQQPKIKKKELKRSAPNARLLLLTIDVTRPQKELLDEIRRAIRLHRGQLSQIGLVPIEKIRTRRRLDQYSVYLRVWDLRQSGRSFPQIAQEIYPKEYPLYPAPRNPIVQRVADHFHRAEALVQGGYKELR